MQAIRFAMIIRTIEKCNIAGGEEYHGIQCVDHERTDKGLKSYFSWACVCLIEF